MSRITTSSAIGLQEETPRDLEPLPTTSISVRRQLSGRSSTGLSKEMLAQFLERYGPVCQLRIHPDCSKEQIWVLDHFIPLSSNVLNNTLRRLPRVGNAKVATQSFGSNHPDNPRLACNRCNAFK
jgi:hypothetical protein